jgi:hypothetical protein
MKLFAIIISLLLLISCNNSNAPDELVILDEVPVETLNTDTVEEEVSTNSAVQENPLTMADIPQIWYKLEKMNDEEVIHQYCEAETQQLQFEQENGGWFILVIYGQDSQRYKVLEFEGYEEFINQQTIIKGMFIIENPSYPDMDTEMYDFIWNTNDKYGVFEGFFNESTKMVSDKNKSSYRTIKENCDYLNE